VARGGADSTCRWTSSRCAADRMQATLRKRDFTSTRSPSRSGGTPIDPLGGLRDLATGTLQMASPSAFSDDPLGVLRLARIAVELELEPEAQTVTGRARERTRSREQRG